ncbi:hypothetical protein [Caballeronia sp. BCC1704]|uniref:hypothetical protein n=1 Tax=Caballeronia sp. BCC1704 TaxID=2676300 RepID=UPI00158B5D41|nr:hypothetical protein [Caballeronia sp. BCC1704]
MLKDNLKGTSNVVRQFSEYAKLREAYSTQTANELTVGSLARHGVKATPSEVGAWHKLNMAAAHGKMEIEAIRRDAESSARVVATAMIASARNACGSQLTLESDLNEDDANETGDGIDEEEERLTIDEIYGHDDPEANADAALDDVLKLK